MIPISEIDQLTQSHGVAVAILIVMLVAIVGAATHLYRENKRLYDKIEQLQQATIDRLLREGAREKTTIPF